MVHKPAAFHEHPPTAEVETPNKAVVEVAVADALGSDGSLDASDIAVTMVGDVVVLNGHVLQAGEIERAGEIAMSIAGVREVDNRLICAGLRDVLDDARD